MLAQVPDPAWEPLDKAFSALRAKDYDTAIRCFEQAVDISPKRADIRKNLAYTLLKTGETEAAREQFGEAVRIDPADFHVALEYAFLCYEARDDAPARKAEARRIFQRVRDTAPDPEAQSTAARAFRNVDDPLRDGIARWKQALASSKPSFSAHYELAQLAEQRDELDLAAANYRAAFRLLPERKSVLLELARAERARGNAEGAMSALLAASRGGEPRASELARERLPVRYPYVYEFRNALDLDPENATLRKELGYLLLSMSEKDAPSKAEAVKEFQSVVEAHPDDYLAAAQLGMLYLADKRDSAAMPLLKQVLARGDPVAANRVRMALHMPLVLVERAAPESALDPRILAERSYNAGFLKDALRLYTQAHEANPVDSDVVLKLGWTNNMLHNDVEAVRWFKVAGQSSDPKIAAEAKKAFKSLKPGVQRIRTTVWLYPLYSSRWSDIFGYGQAKAEVRVGSAPFRPYLSLRMVGDVRRTTISGPTSQSLSESAFVVAAGVATKQWHGAMGWFEAGRAVVYLNGRQWTDIRGGITYSKTRGASLAAERGGLFAETTADSVFISYFGRDWINYTQNKVGYTSILGGWKTQFFWGGNLTFDAQGQYWANFTETGPGFRFHPPGLPPSVAVTLNVNRGVYLRNEGNPRRPNFNDFRAGVWYAFTK